MQMDEPDAEGRAQHPQEILERLLVAATEFAKRRAAVGAVLLDAPAIAAYRGERVTDAAARALDERARMSLGAASAVNDVQDAQGRPEHAVVRGQRGFAQRLQRIARDVIAHEVEVIRMPLEQDRGVANAERLLRAFERAAAGMQHERFVAQHVAKPRSVRTQAKIVLLAVTCAEGCVERANRVDQRAADVQAEADAGRKVRIVRDRRGRDGGAHSLGISSLPATLRSRTVAGTSRSPHCSRTA